jgi:S1-C subfamily serine protease
MKKVKYYNSIFAILRIDTTLQQNNARVAGTGFIINTNPLRVLTCNHVVSEGTPENDGKIVYSIIKRSDENKDFDLRNAQISFLKAKNIIFEPEYDLAILEIDPSQNKEIAEKIGIPNTVESLEFDFEEMTIGDNVEWMSAGTLGDLTITPRLFKGNIITKYIKDNSYKFINPSGAEETIMMKGINLFEVDQLFFPGCSGSPIISPKNGKVIGWVHGFNSWQLPPNIVASLSIGINSSNIKDFLYKNNLIKK